MPNITENRLWEECVDALCALDSVQKEEVKHTHMIHHSNHITINNDASDNMTMIGQDDLHCSRTNNCKNLNWEEGLDALCVLDSKQKEEVEQPRINYEPNHFAIKTDANDKVSKGKDQSQYASSIDKSKQHESTKRGRWHVVVRPSDNDIVLGRGHGANRHPGNIHFRCLVKKRKAPYQVAARRLEKTKITTDLVNEVYSYGGRFLLLVEDEKTHKPCWIVASDTVARSKTSQALREKSPSEKSRCSYNLPSARAGCRQG